MALRLFAQELPVQGQVIGDHAVRPEAFSDPSAALMAIRSAVAGSLNAA